MHTIAHDTIPAPSADAPAAYYFRLEVSDGRKWGPAVAGVLNLTGDDDATASTFGSIHDAMVALDALVLPTKPAAVRLVRSDGRVLLHADFDGWVRA